MQRRFKWHSALVLLWVSVFGMIAGVALIGVSILVWLYSLFGNIFLVGSGVFLASASMFMSNRKARLRIIASNKARVNKIRRDYFDTSP